MRCPVASKQTMSTSLRTTKMLCATWLLILFAVSLLTNTSYAQTSQTPSTLRLSGELASQINITPFIASYVDTSRTMGLSDIRALPDSSFVQTDAIPSFGYTRDIIWHVLDFDVEADLTKNHLLEIQPTYLNFIDVFLYRDTAPEPLWRANLGDNVPASLRDFNGGTHVAALPLLPAGQYRIYTRVESNSTNFIQAKFWPTNELISSLTVRNLATNVFFGLIVTLGIAYFTLGLIARDAVVVIYGIWVVTVGAVVAIVNGLVLSELRPELPWLNDFLLGESNVISHAATAFLWLYITGIKARHPRIFKLGCAYIALILVFMIGSTNGLYTVFGSYIVPSHSLFMASMCLFLASRLFEDVRSWQVWSYLIVLAFPTASAIALQLAHSGTIAVTPMRLAMHQFTLLFHIIGMGILMAVRLSHMDKERLSVSLRAEETTTLVEEQRKLISMLSHEFRTPLAVIQRSAEMLMLRLKDHAGDVQERLTRIQMQARKLARLVDIFLNKDGIENQEFSLARELVLLNSFMEDFVAHTSREGAEIKLTCHDTETFEAYIDETLVGLAITNLIETSRRFAHGNPIHIELYRHTSWLVEIAIPCQGAELDDDEIRLIGDALFRRDMEAKSLRNALGLHISQRIVDAHGGSIKLRDRGIHGIELCLLLPCEETAIER